MQPTLTEILPAELQSRNLVLRQIMDCFEKNDFTRITTPTFEPADPLMVGWDEYLTSQAIQFINEDGVRMVLRPEMTSPIARLIASRQGQLELPLKLFYKETVFRKNHILRKQEFIQVGVEYLGDSSVAADAMLIKLCIDTLIAAGLKKFKVSVGHMENLIGCSEKDKKSLLTKHYFELNSLPEVGDSSILEKGSKLYTLSQELQKMGSHYQSHILYDLGLVESMPYYSGMIFSVLLEGVGLIAGCGGRYDHFLKRYGWDIPAVGFALEFETLVMALEKQV